MTERKKPGPKPKCKECGRKEGMGHEDDCPVGLSPLVDAPELVRLGQVNVSEVKLTVDDLGGCDAATAAYAVRIWNGQSVSVPVNERISRVLNALRGQKLIPEFEANAKMERWRTVVAAMKADGITPEDLKL